MIYCESCGHQIHETATACPRCGALRNIALPREKGFSMSLVCFLLSICLIPACIASFITLFTGTTTQFVVSLSLYILLFLLSAVPAIYNICTKEQGRELNIATLVLISLHLGPIILIAKLL